MSIQALIKRAEAAHAGKTSEAECEVLTRELEQEIKQMMDRAADLRYDEHGEPAPGRAAVLATNDPKAVVAADQQIAELEATAELLSPHLDRVRKAIPKARVAESDGKARDACKRLGPALATLEKANTARAAARAEVENIRSQLLAARRVAKEGGIDVPGLTEKEHDRLCQALGMPTGNSVEAENARVTQRMNARQLVEGWKPPEKPKRKALGW